MSALAEFKKDLIQIKKEWIAQDSTIRLLDILSFFGILVFGIAYILVSVLDIKQTVTNMAFMIYPAIIAGYSFVFRMKLGDPDVDIKGVRKEYIGLVSLTTFLVLLSFVYSFLLE